MIEKDIKDEIIEKLKFYIDKMLENLPMDRYGNTLHLNTKYFNSLFNEVELLKIKLKKQQSLSWDELAKILVEAYGFTYAAVGGLSYNSNGNHIEIKPSGDIYINHDWQKRLTIPISKNRTPIQMLTIIQNMFDKVKE